MTRRAILFRRIGIILTVALILEVGAYIVIKRADDSRSTLPVLGKVPSFALQSQDGKPFDRNNLLNKINVVDFIFTRCQGPCPIMSDHMTDLYKLYANSDKVQFVSISVDPDYDSIGVLQDYAVSHGVTDGRWKFLTGPLDSIKALSENGFMLAADDLPASHSTKFVLVDGSGDIRAYYDGTEQASMNILKTNINELVKQLK
ncbi:MAG TPA: SCO family protein [candidate division Zixibacteria bacterium]|nr:SCO family protein [candidate division Zixibacteria bacterium]